MGAPSVPPVIAAVKRIMKAALVHAPLVEVSPKDLQLILTGWSEAIKGGKK